MDSYKIKIKYLQMIDSNGHITWIVSAVDNETVEQPLSLLIVVMKRIMPS